jgi:hypothetical protein
MPRHLDACLGGRPAPSAAAPPANPAAGSVVEFVCEDDVKQAIRLGRKIVIGERTIVTPAARDLAEAQRVFVQASFSIGARS